MTLPAAQRLYAALHGEGEEPAPEGEPPLPEEEMNVEMEEKD